MAFKVSIIFVCLVAISGTRAQYCCKECYQTCLNIWDNVPSTTFNDLSAYLRQLKAEREMSNAQSTQYVIDSSVQLNLLTWKMQKYLAASTAYILMDKTGQCNPITFVQYANELAWTFDDHHCLKRCEAAKKLRSLRYIERMNSSCNDLLWNACRLTKEIRSHSGCPTCISKVGTEGMLLAFTNTYDQMNGMACCPFEPKIATRINHGYVPPKPKFQNHAKHWENYFYPTIFMNDCLKHFCCPSESSGSKRRRRKRQTGQGDLSSPDYNDYGGFGNEEPQPQPQPQLWAQQTLTSNATNGNLISNAIANSNDVQGASSNMHNETKHVMRIEKPVSINGTKVEQCNSSDNSKITHFKGGSLKELQSRFGILFGRENILDQGVTKLKRMYNNDVALLKKGIDIAKGLGLNLKGWQPPLFTSDL